MIRLDYFTEEDFDDLISWVNDTDPAFFMKWSGPTFTYPLTIEQLNNYSEGANKSGSDAFIFKVVVDETNEAAGHLALRKIDSYHSCARLGKVLISPDYRGKGFAKPAIRKALEFAFEYLDLNRLALGVFSFNTPAYQLYRETGFTEEGYFRDFRRVGDEYWDMYEMAMLKKDYVQKIENDDPA
ncbi:GNAT family N-acetyltransferase [Bacillus sp. H-16]|uniref:GNAT family N-acetyltransferase n=1 Tax=Alteribacter salitolerans TaxID=2912333 RepID=UPI001963C793|nr:GNAT family N-acetyltransferase [Alteribacter salitolerans]